MCMLHGAGWVVVFYSFVTFLSLIPSTIDTTLTTFVLLHFFILNPSPSVGQELFLLYQPLIIFHTPTWGWDIRAVGLSVVDNC